LPTSAEARKRDTRAESAREFNVSDRKLFIRLGRRSRAATHNPAQFPSPDASDDADALDAQPVSSVCHPERALRESKGSRFEYLQVLLRSFHRGLPLKMTN
jgi:hypothetical protein